MFSSIAAAPASCIDAGVAGPAAGRDAVEAGDHGDVDGGRGALEQAQVAARAGVLVGGRREVGQRLGEALGAGVGQPRVARRLAAQLLLEQRVQHDRADAGVREPAHAVRRSATAARRTRRAGCAARGPCSVVARSISDPCERRRGTAARRGRPSPRRPASAARPPAAARPCRRSASAGSVLASAR